ncbi:hypothetical protein BGZ61DRAFT_552233 [Ilyonectria robusta]|uniref:uncharacterized protein n=1 Tax=Ilyonectria robusta TaxID=1079257 RepID=UPI001E8EC04F|nr:uncharacterized protein BGZ61DRAFT_552233 [Ilyonectria robusta]KAH8676903.1 hypothetical protein BGZ61DRAFT_552233 [Ilyonectria robusta]
MAKNAAKNAAKPPRNNVKNTAKAPRGKTAKAQANNPVKRKTVRMSNKDAADADDESDVDNTVKTRLDNVIETQGEDSAGTGTIKYTIILVAMLSFILCGAFFAVVAVPKDETKGRLCALQYDIHSVYGRHRSAYDIIGVTISDTAKNIMDSYPMQIGKTVERDPEDDGEFNRRMAVVNAASLVLLSHKERGRYNVEIYGPSGLAELDGVEKRLEYAQRAQNQKACMKEGEMAEAMQADVDARLREVCKGYVPGEFHV